MTEINVWILIAVMMNGDLEILPFTSPGACIQAERVLDTRVVKTSQCFQATHKLDSVLPRLAPLSSPIPVSKPGVKV